MAATVVVHSFGLGGLCFWRRSPAARASWKELLGEGVIETVEVTGRLRRPLSKKLNPIWWFLNDDEQRVDDGTADWYHPEWPAWRRYFYWNFLRNPLMNLRNYVIGVADRNYKVTRRAFGELAAAHSQ
jgi:hypothetical protein